MVAKGLACAKSVSVIFQGMLGGVSIPTKIVLAIDPDLLKHAGKGMGMCQKGFGN